MKKLALTLMAACCFLSSATAQEDIVDTAIGAGSFSTLVAAVQAAGLEDTLRGEGPFTVLAPTDDAFAALPDGTLDALLADPEALANILLYHVISGSVTSDVVVTLDSATTVQGSDVAISLNGDAVMINDATVVAPDVMASNGVIHVIDTVLIPPAENTSDVVDVAADAGIFTTLIAAVQAAGLEDTLRGEGPFTVLAPTDDAFAALPSGTLDALLADPETLASILLYHVISGAVTSDVVATLDSATTVQGADVSIAVEDGAVKINDATVIGPDVMATNGVIHTIDTVLLPPSPRELDDIVDTAIGAGIFQTLVAAVQAAGLEDALRGDGPLTVLAPTDDAFAALPDGTIDALLADPEALTQVLLYHVIDGAVTSDIVVTLDSATTLQGSDVAISVENDMVKINDATVTTPDVEASNGIIHIIDTVLLPPAEEKDIVDTAVEAGRFSTLATALGAADLVDALKGNGPFTVFAPNDDAFAALPEGVLDALLADTDALTQVLLYHVAAGEFTAADVLARNQILTLQGNRARIMNGDAGPMIDNAGIIGTDIMASNGIIHEIDTVILPPELAGDNYTLTITNVTKSQTFSPPLIVAHSNDTSIVELGSEASTGVAYLAQDGDRSMLIDELYGNAEVYNILEPSDPIGPGETVTYTIKTTYPYRNISFLSMLVASNDSFIGETITSPAREWFKRAEPFTSVSMVHALDAGSEYNSEDCAHIPGGGCGSVGASPEQPGEGFVHVANGIHGIGDLSASMYHWTGPVARIVLKSR